MHIEAIAYRAVHDVGDTFLHFASFVEQLTTQETKTVKPQLDAFNRTETSLLQVWRWPRDQQERDVDRRTDLPQHDTHQRGFLPANTAPHRCSTSVSRRRRILQEWELLQWSMYNRV